MRANIKYVEAKYAEFNKLCFGGELPTLPVCITNAKTYLGAIRFRKRKTMLGRIEYYDFKLCISVKYDLPEHEIEDTIIHEMIHYYIFHKKLKDTSTHGTIFRKIMNDINRRFGRHLAVSHRNSAENLESDRQQKPHIICVTEFPDGRKGITVCARPRIFDIYRDIPRYYKVKSCSWYYSADPFFNRYPNSRTAKIFKVDEAELNVHLAGAVPLECDGRKMWRKG